MAENIDKIYTFYLLFLPERVIYTVTKNKGESPGFPKEENKMFMVKLATKGDIYKVIFNPDSIELLTKGSWGIRITKGGEKADIDFGKGQEATRHAYKVLAKITKDFESGKTSATIDEFWDD